MSPLSQAVAVLAVVLAIIGAPVVFPLAAAISVIVNEFLIVWAARPDAGP